MLQNKDNDGEFMAKKEEREKRKLNMKKKFVALIFVGLLLFSLVLRINPIQASMIPESAESLFADDFENGSSNWVGEGGGDWEITTNLSHNGAKSLHLTCDPEDSPNYVAVVGADIKNNTVAINSTIWYSFWLFMNASDNWDIANRIIFESWTDFKTTFDEYTCQVRLNVYNNSAVCYWQMWGEDVIKEVDFDQWNLIEISCKPEAFWDGGWYLAWNVTGYINDELIGSYSSGFYEEALSTIHCIEEFEIGCVAPDTTHHLYFDTYKISAENVAPTNDACDSDATFDVGVNGWVNMTVSDTNLVADLNTVSILVTTFDSKTFRLNWTQATNTFSEELDASGICTLGTGVRTNLNTTQDRISFQFAISAGAQKGACSVVAQTIDDSSSSDSDTYAAEFSINFYLSLTIDDGTFGWTGLSPGDVNATLSGDGAVNFTITANNAWYIAIKADAENLVNGTNTIPCGAILFAESGLEEAVSLTTDYYGFMGYSACVSEPYSFKMWITIPNPQPSGTYTITISIAGYED